MKFNIENLKRRAQQISEETRIGANTSERIGNMFYDISSELNSVYKKINRRSFILSFTSITISIIALILSIFKSDDITVNGANLLGVMVGVLAFLVTLLIGFQIYKAIEVEDTIDKKMNSIEERMMETLKTLIEVKVESEINKNK